MTRPSPFCTVEGCGTDHLALQFQRDMRLSGPTGITEEELVERRRVADAIKNLNYGHRRAV